MLDSTTLDTGPKVEKDPETKPKNVFRRQSSEPESPPPKRHGRGAKHRNPKRDSSPGDSGLSSELSSSPERKRKRDLREESDEERKHVKREQNGRGDQGAQVKRRRSPSGTEASVKDQVGSGSCESKTSVKGESRAGVGQEEEYSDVIDEPAAALQKREEAGFSSKSSKSGVKKASSPDDPQEAEIKKLQHQLSKCGVRKLWHNELKRHGDDARSKIRHLKRMLAEVGMEGRFSEAKAREIRETRELLAEAEAAQEMNALWGLGSGTRRSRNKAKTMKMAEDHDEDSFDEHKEGEENGKSGGRGRGRGTGGGPPASGSDDDDAEETFAARRRRAQADLAFLGDDSDDSD